MRTTVLFTTKSCSHCREVWGWMERAVEGEVSRRIERVYCDDGGEGSRRATVSAINTVPTLIVMRGGEEVGRHYSSGRFSEFEVRDIVRG